MKTASTPASVLIVDDIPQNISLLNAALMGEYTIKVTSCWAESEGYHFAACGGG